MTDSGSSSREKGGHAGPGDSRAVSTAKDKVQEAAAKAKDTASSAADKTKGVAATFVQNVEDMATNAAQKTKDMASSAVKTVEDVASSIGRQVGGAVDSVGDGMKSIAGTIRDKAPEGGVLGSAASGLASGLESGGTYLREHNLQGMAKDVAGVIRNYPLQSILVGIGVGILIGRASRSNHGH